MKNKPRGQIAVRLDAETERMLDVLREEMSAEDPAANRSDVIRRLIRLAAKPSVKKAKR